MYKFYKLAVFLLLSTGFSTAFAQKTLRLQVTNLTNSPGTDCDGVANNSDWQWTFAGGASGCDYKNGSSAAENWNPNRTIWGTNTYYSRDCWPTGTLSVQFRYQENDNIGDCDASGSCSRTDNWTYPAYNAANGSYQQNGSSTGTSTFSGSCTNDCPTAITYTYTGGFEVGGSYNSSNLDGNGYTNNKTCSTAIDIDGGTEATGQLVTNAANQCTEAWYIYDVTSTNLSALTFSGANGYVRVYTGGSGGSCGTLFQVAEGSGGATVKDATPCRYYIKIEANGGQTNLSVSKSASGISNDFVCNANNLGTMPSGGGTLQLNAENNFGSTSETSEPNINTSDNDYKTDWYKFTTGSTVPSKVDIGVEENGDNIDADFHLYKLNDNAYSLPCRCSGAVNWAKLTDIADGDGGDNVSCIGSHNSYLSGVCIDPNSTYYIQVRGYRNGGLCPNEDEGNFRVYVTGSTTPKGPDDICSASVITGSLPINYNSGNINFNNNCDGVQTGEPHTTSGNKMHHTAWYSFTTPSTNVPSSVSVEIEENGSGANNSAVAVYQSSGGCTFGSLTEKAFNWWCNSSGGTISFDCLAPSTTYYIQAGTAYNSNDGVLCVASTESTGDYYIKVTTPDIVVGADEICNAENLGVLSKNTTLKPSGDKVQTNRCATNNTGAGEVNNPNSGNETVWYKFTTGATLGRYCTIKILSQSSSYINADFRLYKDPTPATCNYTDLQQNYWFQDGQISCVGNTYMDATYNQICLEPNSTYYIQVFGSNPGGATLCSGYDIGNFKVEVSDDNITVPVNDRICGAKNIAVQTKYTYNSMLLSAETNINGTDCFDPQPDWAELGKDNDYGVWYYIGQIPGRTMVVDANSLSSDNIDLELALYSTPSSSCNDPLTEVQKEYAGAGVSWDEDAYFNCLDPNKYYWLLVDGADFTGTGIASALEQGNFSLRAWFPEEGETNACNAEDLGSVPDGGNIYIRNLSNICGSPSITNFPAPSAFSFDKAVVYKFKTPPAVGYTDASVLIEGFSNPYYAGATHDVLGGPGGNMGLAAGDEIDMQLALYSPGACGSAHYVVGSNYDVTVGIHNVVGNNESLIVNCLQPNTEYYLVVDGSPLNSNGYYDLRISDYGKHTPNDFLCNAIDITGTYNAPWTNCNSNTVVTLTGQNNYCATTNNDIPSSLGIRPPAWSEMNSPVWYKFKAPKSGKLKIEAINTVPDAVPPYDEPEISAQLAVFFLPGGYQGTCTNLSNEKDRLQYIGSDHDALFHDEEYTIECLMPDSIYYLLVDGSSETLCPGCTRGEFYLKLTADPRDRAAPNDLICDAIDLGTPAVWTNPTIYDTKVSPASGANTYSSPTTGYTSATGLHNGARDNGYSCMRAENNFCAGIDNEPAVNGGTFFTDFSPDATVWYKFTAPSTGEVKINSFSDPSGLGDLLYTQLAVFETSDNTCTGNMVGIAADGLPDNLNGDNELTVKCLDPGKTYFLMVDGSGVNVHGYFELQIQAVPATLTGPPNDDICNATPITYPGSIGATTTLNNQTNRCATIQNIYPSPTTFTTDADVWYTFTTPNTAGPHAVNVTITSGLPWPFGDAMDPQIALYKMNPVGGPCASSFTLVDDDYSPLGLPFYESFDFHCLEQNTTYYLMVDGSGLNEQGNFKVDVKRINPHPLAANDNICAVTNSTNGNLGTLGAITGNKVGNTSTNWHNFCSTVEPGESALMTDNNYSLDQTVWFKFRTPNTANNVDVEIRALNDPNNVGDQIDLQMLLAQGTPGCSPTDFTSLTPIESVDPALTFNATMDVCLPPNTDFYIQVDGSGLNKQGYFTLEVENKGLSSAPSNDNICNAKTLPNGGVITGSYTGYLNDNNNCATLENFEKQQVAGSIQRSVWYKFVAPPSADVSIQVKGDSWVPFSSNYFLPDVTIWELNDGTFASPATSISGCPNPTAAQWNKLAYNDYQGIPNSLANGVYPTVVLTPLCLKPGYTYYVQVDGIAGVGLDGNFDITIKDNQPSYSGPTNNEAAGATTVPISSASCQYSNGTWQSPAGYSFGNNPTWSNPSLIGISNPAALPSCTQNCGDVWYKFQMPAACGNNTKSFIKIEGDDEFNLDINGYPELAIAAYNGGPTTSTSNLSYLKCSVGGTGVDPDFSISANPGDWIYLQIWDLNGDEQYKTFKLCVSEQKSADDCADATNMTLDIPYCWSVESNTGETPNPAVPGSGLNTCFGTGVPQHSSYFTFTTDAAGNFCDDYYVYINTAALAKQLPSGPTNACLGGVSSSVSFNYTLWKLKPGGTTCTPGTTNVSQEDCIIFNDCGGGSFGSNVVGPHGNGGVVDDTIWYNIASGQALLPSTTYYIVLDYNIDNPIYKDRVILDGIIQVGRRCKGRTWEYTTAPSVSTNKYCTSSDGWRHYYDDKGTPATSDDKYIFSLFPNGNNIEGTATITLDPTYYSNEAPAIDYAEYVMKRRWNFTLSSGTVNPAKPVKIRFYYQTPEKQDIINAANSFKNTYGGFYEDFEWFKSANGHVFDPNTDVSPKAISVGPNGFSETGCLSYWNDLGVYVGPPGISRCQTIGAIDWEDNNAYQSCNGIHYVEYSGITGFSGGTGGTGVSPWDISPLPVELISFTGYNDGAVNVLNWKTASELNTSKFVVERSPQSSNNQFAEIGELPAAGNSNVQLAYTLNDLNPLIGDNYYRLKIIDNNGTFKYSNTILIRNDKDVVYTNAIHGIYPNPTNSLINIEYQSQLNSKILIQIQNVLGQEMMTVNKNAIKGNQLLQLDVSTFANGVYIINIQDATTGKNVQAKFIKD